MSRGKSRLTLHNVTPADSGDYECVSRLSKGWAKWKTFVHVTVYSMYYSIRKSHLLNLNLFSYVEYNIKQVLDYHMT